MTAGTINIWGIIKVLAVVWGRRVLEGGQEAATYFVHCFVWNTVHILGSTVNREYALLGLDLLFRFKF